MTIISSLVLNSKTLGGTEIIATMKVQGHNRTLVCNSKITTFGLVTRTALVWRGKRIHQEVMDNDSKVLPGAEAKIVANGPTVGPTVVLACLARITMTIVRRDLVPIITIVGVKWNVVRLQRHSMILKSTKRRRRMEKRLSSDGCSSLVGVLRI
jgi:hypothetical protein